MISPITPPMPEKYNLRLKNFGATNFYSISRKYNRIMFHRTNISRISEYCNEMFNIDWIGQICVFVQYAVVIFKNTEDEMLVRLKFGEEIYIPKEAEK